MTTTETNIIPFPSRLVDGFAEAACAWQASEDSLDAVRRGVWRLERSELTQAGVAMAEHVEEALHADAEVAFLEAAEAAFSLYERILIEAGRLSNSLRNGA